MEIKHLETFMENGGKWCCYVADVIKLACNINGTEHNLTNIGKALDIGLDKGYIKFNEKNYKDDDNWTMLHPDKFLTALTGKTFTVTHESRKYKLQPGEYEILFYAKTESDGSKGIGHFVLPDYDPLSSSITVKTGFIYSKRIFRCKA